MSIRRVNHRKVIHSLSAARLSSYQRPGLAPAGVLREYAKNVRLAEAFYPVLQHLEIVLRNRFEAVFVTKYGPDWYKHSDFLYLLDRHARNEIFKAVEKLAKAKRPIVSGAVVAELMFGFWTSLFNKEYEIELWRPYNANLFPSATASQRNIQAIRDDLTKLRQTRNRIAHHEPIARNPIELRHRYDLALKLLEWMSPDAKRWLECSGADRFVRVHDSIFKPKPRKVRSRP